MIWKETGQSIDTKSKPNLFAGLFVGQNEASPLNTKHRRQSESEKQSNKKESERKIEGSRKLDNEIKNWKSFQQ